MKPRNARQREVAALFPTLPPLTARQEQWAADHCFSSQAFLCKKQAWCSCCGTVFAEDCPPAAASIDKVHTVCPGCGRRLRLVVSRRQKLEEKVYYTVLTTRRGWQVCRHFVAFRRSAAGRKPGIRVLEAVQNWIAPDGHEEVVARPVACIPQYYDQWVFTQPLDLRAAGTDRLRPPSGYGRDKYCVDSTWTYPERRLLPLVRRNGFSGRCDTLPVAEYIKMLLTDREAETLSKAGQWGLLCYKWERCIGEFGMPFAHAVRVACRHKLRVQDADVWFDGLRMLDEAGRDTHNPAVIDPARVQAEHDRLVRRRQREYARRKQLEALEYENQYRREKGKYFGLRFKSDGISVGVIRSVAEMAEEGKSMHHCVFAAGYYKRPDSLILSARDSNGQRLETVEVSLKSFRVVQSRALQNGITPQHDDIVNLVEQNMDKIKGIS